MSIERLTTIVTNIVETKSIKVFYIYYSIYYFSKYIIKDFIHDTVGQLEVYVNAIKVDLVECIIPLK